MVFKRRKEPTEWEIEPEWPRNGDTYFWVRSDIGGVCKSKWADDVSHHEFRWATGNCFRTRSEAEEAIGEAIAYFSWKGMNRG